MFASILSSYSLFRFVFYVSRVFDDEWREGTKILCPATREKYRERGRRCARMSRRFSREKEEECLKEMKVMLASRVRTSQRALSVAFSTMMMCFLFLSCWRPLSFLSCCEHKGEKIDERKYLVRAKKRPSREGAKSVGVALSREELWNDAKRKLSCESRNKSARIYVF